jgi:hypothetical protein
MDACNTTFSASHVLNEQTARQIFDILPEEGVIVAILDRDGTRWTSDSDAFDRVGLDEASLADLRARVDDGVELVVARLGDASVSMAQLSTEHTNCGYAMVVLPRGTAKAAISDVNLLEAYMAQIALVARLTEKNRQLMKARTGYYGGPGSPDSSMN